MLQLDLKLCGGCGGCVAVCPTGALELFSSGLSIKPDICTLCENCVIFCPVEALKIEPKRWETSSISKKKNPN